MGKPISLFDTWCESDRNESNGKHLWKLSEKQSGRSQVEEHLYVTVRAHYDRIDRIAEDVEQLGFAIAATTLRERLPRTKKARSGDLGEILASELVEEEMGFDVPIRRMRYKDGREVPLRGDDFIGVKYGRDEGLRLLKGEAKSRAVLGKTTITEARKALNRDNGRCTPCSLLFVADRLLDRDGDQRELGRVLRKEVGTKTLVPARIDHVLFTLSGNAPPAALEEDLQAAEEGRNHTVINIRIEDHQTFIADVYEGAANLGDD
jgi:hypothetical protein